MRVLLDEGHIEHTSAVGLCLVIGGEYVLADAQDDGDVAAGFDLVVLAADHGLFPVSISVGFCGLMKVSSPFSRTGLNVMICTPRFAASCNGCRKRGLFEPVFWPKKNIASQLLRSSNTTVPTPAPITFFRATEVVSWHMLELSGRLLLP